MRGQKYPADVKGAVMAALLAGQAVDEVAKAYNIPYRTVYEWQNSLTEDEFRQVQNKKRDEIGALLMGYLRETLITLKAQAIYFRNETWLSKQSAADVAVLHGVACDKGIRLLEAIERAAQAQAYQPIAGELPESTTESLPS